MQQKQQDGAVLKSLLLFTYISGSIQILWKAVVMIFV